VVRGRGPPPDPDLGDKRAMILSKPLPADLRPDGVEEAIVMMVGPERACQMQAGQRCASGAVRPLPPPYVAARGAAPRVSPTWPPRPAKPSTPLVRNYRPERPAYKNEAIPLAVPPWPSDPTETAYETGNPFARCFAWPTQYLAWIGKPFAIEFR